MIIQFITKFDHYVFSDNLPEDHPNKPRDWLSKTLTKVSASISTEVAMTMGLEVSFLDIAGTCCLATVRVPMIEKDMVWIGIFGKWKHIFTKEVPKDR